MADLLSFLPLLVEEESAADEGRKIITAMLITGFVFLAVIALGQFSRWVRHRKH